MARIVILATTAMISSTSGRPVKRGKRMDLDQAKAHVIENFGEAVWEALTETTTPSGNHMWHDGIWGGQTVRMHYQD